MSYLLEVCVFVLTLGAAMVYSFAADPPGAVSVAQELRAGISVHLANSRSGTPMPEADRNGSLIVAVTRSGAIFLGIKPTEPAVLADSIKAQKAAKVERKVYIKSDARAQFAKVVEVLEAVRAAGDVSAVLLTRQRVTPKPATPVPPYGLEVLAGPSSGDSSQAAVVEMFHSGGQAPKLQINGRLIPWHDLQSSMRETLQGRKTGVAIIRADGSLPYADVVHVIDACHSLGTRIALSLQGQ